MEVISIKYQSSFSIAFSIKYIYERNSKFKKSFQVVCLILLYGRPNMQLLDDRGLIVGQMEGEIRPDVRLLDRGGPIEAGSREPSSAGIGAKQPNKSENRFF